MTPEAQRIAIAEACGFSGPFSVEWIHEYTEEGGDVYLLAGTRYGDREPIPDYLRNLNSMHEAEKVLQHYGVFVDKLAGVMDEPLQGIMLPHATASQRAEAFLRTIGKWEASK